MSTPYRIISVLLRPLYPSICAFSGDADVVTPEKRGYYVHYRLNEKTLRRWKDMTDDLLEEGQM